MMSRFPKELSKKLQQRRETNSFRRLVINNFKIDFVSNDYIGFSKNKNIQNKAIEITKKIEFINGSTGSRLISGNHNLHLQLEDYLAYFHNSETALLFNSGYDANIGLFSSVLQKETFVLYDELIHASIRDGIILSKAKAYKFKHNSLEDLEYKFSRCTGAVFIAVESVYSMDGDIAPLPEIIEFSKKNNCYLIVDEAHSTGVFGKKGEGLLQELNLEKDVFARIHTFGKAIGCHGAAVLGSQKLKDYLINFSRPFIYTTAAPLHSIAAIKAAYLELEDTRAINKLKENIKFFNTLASDLKIQKLFIKSNSAIQCCIFSGNERVKQIAETLSKKNVEVKAILYPTISKGQERLRITLHSYNTFEEIEEILKLLKVLSIDT